MKTYRQFTNAQFNSVGILRLPSISGGASSGSTLRATTFARVAQTGATSLLQILHRSESQFADSGDPRDPAQDSSSKQPAPAQENPLADSSDVLAAIMTRLLILAPAWRRSELPAPSDD